MGSGLAHGTLVPAETSASHGGVHDSLLVRQYVCVEYACTCTLGVCSCLIPAGGGGISSRVEGTSRKSVNMYLYPTLYTCFLQLRNVSVQTPGCWRHYGYHGSRRGRNLDVYKPRYVVVFVSDCIFIYVLSTLVFLFQLQCWRQPKRRIVYNKDKSL